MLKFGTDYALFTVCEFFSKNLDNALIGKFYGSDVLGFYSRAYHLLSLLNKNIRAPLDNIAVPALSRLHKNPERYREYCIRFTAIMAFVTMPVSTLMFVCADNIIWLVMGHQWGAAIPIFRVFAVLSLIQSVMAIRNTVMVTSGNSKKLRRWGVINSLLTMLSICIGLSWGGLGVAVSFTIMSYLLLYPSLHYCLKDEPFNIVDFNKSIVRAFIASILAGCLCVFLKSSLVAMNDFLVIMIVIVVGLTGYLIVFCSQKNGRAELKSYFSYLEVAMGK